MRIKNENLVFGTINIRLGIALSGDGFRKADYFHISSEQRKDPLRYIPEQAAPVDYRSGRKRRDTPMPALSQDSRIKLRAITAMPLNKP